MENNLAIASVNFCLILKKLEQFERENTKLSSEHNSINNSIQVKQDKDVNFDNTINNNDILKSVAKEIKSIDDLKTIAKHIGIDQTVYKISYVF